MKRILFILSAAAILLFQSCEHNIDADLENLEGVLCLNAFLITDSDTNFVHVSLTSRTKPVPVPNARIELSVNGNLVETVTDCYKITYKARWQEEVYDDDWGWMWIEKSGICTDTIFGTYMLTSKFNVGDKVRVDVYSGSQHVWAADVAPQKNENPAVSHTYTHRTMKEIGALLEDHDRVSLDVRFDDISADANYYRMAIYSNYYVENKSFTMLFPEELDLHSKNEIMDYARKNLNHPVFNEFDDTVEVFYLASDLFDGWSGYEDYSYRGNLILSEGEPQSSGESTDLDALITDVENTFRVFSDNLFSNSTARLTATVWCNGMIPDNINRPPYDDLFTDEELNMVGDYYNWHLTVKLQSISEQQYYYLRAMNAITSSSYDEMSNLSGAMKIPTNVHGGSGNFCVTTTTIVKVPILDNYRPPFYDTIYK